LVSAQELREITKTGRRASVSAAIFHFRYEAAVETHPPRFAFVVSRAIGGAVSRNLAKRRLRAICSSWLRDQLAPPTGLDVVVRARSGILEIPFAKLQQDCRGALDSIAAGFKP
jgi:ribonuclease P protein component